MIKILSVAFASLFSLSMVAQTTRPCETTDKNKQKIAINKTIAILDSLKKLEPRLKDVNWMGKIPDGCYCKDTVGTDGKPFNKSFFVCSVGAGSGIEITYSPNMAIDKIQYFEP